MQGTLDGSNGASSARSSLADGGAWRPCQALCGLRAGPCRLQLLPQPASPEVPEHGTLRVAGERQAELLSVPYLHVLFTVSAAVAEIAFQNKATVYALSRSAHLGA